MDIIDTIGLEIEFANIPIEVARNFRPPGWKIVQDGSCRTHRHCALGLEVTKSDNEAVMYGGEFVSPTMAANSGWRSDVESLLNLLTTYGEGVDDRTSIHVHVNCSGFPLFALKNLLLIGRYLEDGVYRLSCAEAGVHRGVEAQDYGFCRPITTGGPPVVYTEDNIYRPVFTIENLLNADTQEEFKMALGRMDRNGSNKYCEPRYVWLNFASLYRYGSIEFRSFNFTNNASNVEAWVELCMEIVRGAFGKITELPAHPLGSRKLTIDELLEFLMVTDEKTISRLERLWNQADYQRAVLGYQAGHLGQNLTWRGVPAKLIPPAVDENEIRRFGENTGNHSLCPGYYMVENFDIGEICVD